MTLLLNISSGLISGFCVTSSVILLNKNIIKSTELNTYADVSMLSSYIMTVIIFFSKIII